MQGGEISPVQLFLEAGPVVKAVIAVLLLASLWCWIIIFEALWTLGRLRRAIGSDGTGKGRMGELIGKIFAAGREEALEAPLPLAHGRDEQRPCRMTGLGGERGIKLLQRLARPEGPFEGIRRLADSPEQHGFVDGDRTDPPGTDDQAEHHGLDQPMGLPEQVKQRQIGRGQRQSRR